MARKKENNTPPTQNDQPPKNIGPYQIGEPLLVGTKEIICQAKDSRTGDPVFLVYLIHLEQEQIERFQRRVETLRQIHHPAIASIEEFGVDEEGRPYAVMPFKQLTPLAEVQQLKDQPQKFTSDLLRFVGQIAGGLHAAHQVGLPHPNLGPAQIFIQADGRPLLLDLMCSPPENFDAEQPGEFLPYPAPEQLQGKSATARSNIFTLGILLYDLLAGHQPSIPRSEWSVFENSSNTLREIPLEEARPGLAQATYHLVHECLWPQEWSRFNSASDFLAALDTAVAAEEKKLAGEKLSANGGNRPRWLLPAVLIAAIIIFLLFRLLLFTP